MKRERENYIANREKKSPLKSEEQDFSADSVVKNPPASAGDTESLLGLGGTTCLRVTTVALWLHHNY